MKNAAWILVRDLFDKASLTDEVIESLTADRTIREPLREHALALARGWQDGSALNDASWSIAATPDGSRDEYARAVRLADEAVRMEPNEGFYLNTLGVAQYRIGDFAKALETLTRSDEINSKPRGRSRPEDLAFLAMAHHQLGHVDDAQKLLDRLREYKAEAQRFLREAETLIEGEK